MRNRTSHPHTEPQPTRASWWHRAECPACRTPMDMRPDEATAGIVFCDECIERSRSITEWDDLGVAD